MNGVEGLKTLCWSVVKWGEKKNKNLTYLRSPEPNRIYHFDIAETWTGISDLCGTYSHLISVWF